MNIIYSAGNRIGSNNQLYRFLKNINSKHKIKIAAYNKSSYNISNIDWILNSLSISSKYFIENLNSSKYNQKLVFSLLDDVIKFEPKLIISDNEYIFAYIAKELNIPLWYCSPLNLILGTKSVEKTIYSSLFYKYIKKYKLPEAEKYLIYSPFCDIKDPPELEKEYSWVRPYYSNYSKYVIEEIDRSIILNNILKYVTKKNDYCFSDGNTSNISDLFYNNKNIIISPNIKNVEALVNSIMIERYNIGYNLGQIELMNYLSVQEIEKAYSQKFNNIELNSEQNLHLDEWIENAYSL